ncbi:hypothetical protein [Candidatus Mycoplasma haematohominis]|uniref:hypothetical protein n=1 Tax=Candidatus Mycoplasma haematohominis TaxID=1494318 RepID=UPI001C0A6C4C|nr:hypothetical protein [Candidatus Mycoplasma haemohominis]
MSALVKAAAGLGVVATVTTGGYFLFADGSIEVFVISDKGSIDSVYKTGTFGNAYADYMADPLAEKISHFEERHLKNGKVIVAKKGWSLRMFSLLMKMTVNQLKKRR